MPKLRSAHGAPHGSTRPESGEPILGVPVVPRMHRHAVARDGDENRNRQIRLGSFALAQPDTKV